MPIYHFTSYWVALPEERWRFAGLIAVTEGFVGIRFPDPQDQTDWVEMESARLADRTVGLVEWLQELAQSGNGITYEYDEVLAVEAPSFDTLFDAAYARIVAEKGLVIPMWETPVACDIVPHDPLKEEDGE